MSEDARNTVLKFIDQKYGLLIYKIAYDILRDHSAVDDVKQQVLISCIPRTEMLSKMAPPHLTAYLTTMIKNEAITELRRRTSRDTLHQKIVDERNKYLYMDHVDFKAFEGTYGFSDEMWALLNQLSPMDRDILVLMYHNRMTTREIAEVIGTNREQVKKRLQRAKAKLVDLIKERGEESYWKSEL